TWLCCAEDFAVAMGVLLIGALALKGVSMLARRTGRSSLALRSIFWLGAYAAAYAVMALMILNFFLYLTIDRFASLNMLLTVHPMVVNSVQRDLSIARQVAIFVIPLAAVALQLLLVNLLPWFWQRLAYLVCRPVTLAAGLALFLGLSFLSRYTLGEDYGGFQHNAAVWALL